MKRMLTMAGLVLAATMLGLPHGSGTLALWNATASSTAQRLTTAEFAVSVKSGEGTTQYLTDGDSVVTLAGQNNLFRVKPGTTAIRLGNASNAGSGTFRARITVGTPVATGELKNHLTLSIAKASGSDCSKTAPDSTVDLAQDQSALLCLPITLAATAPASIVRKQEHRFSTAERRATLKSRSTASHHAPKGTNTMARHKKPRTAGTSLLAQQGRHSVSAH